MNRSEQIHELAAALAKAQAQIEGAVKDKTNPAFRSRYADLGAVWDAIRYPMTAHGLSIVQGLERTDGGVACETMLMHSSGQWIASRFEVPVSKQDAQGFGSAATYVRRYALQAMAGIAPVDDDGNGAVGSAPAAKRVDVKAVLAEAMDAAGNGKSVFTAFWNRIDGPAKTALKPHMDEIKAACEQADAANEQPAEVEQ